MSQPTACASALTSEPFRLGPRRGKNGKVGRSLGFGRVRSLGRRPWNQAGLSERARTGANIARTCHAEGRGFESHHPLSKVPANEQVQSSLCKRRRGAWQGSLALYARDDASTRLELPSSLLVCPVHTEGAKVLQIKKSLANGSEERTPRQPVVNLPAASCLRRLQKVMRRVPVPSGRKSACRHDQPLSYSELSVRRRGDPSRGRIGRCRKIAVCAPTGGSRPDDASTQLALGNGTDFSVQRTCESEFLARTRPLYTSLVAKRLSAWVAADDCVALRFDGTELAEVVSARPGARAYRVTAEGEEPIEPRRLG
jgi:hypothetical protein